MEPFVFGMVLQADGKRVASVADSTLAYIGGRESPRDADIRGIQIKARCKKTRLSVSRPSWSANRPSRYGTSR